MAGSDCDLLDRLGSQENLSWFELQHSNGSPNFGVFLHDVTIFNVTMNCDFITFLLNPFIYTFRTCGIYNWLYNLVSPQHHYWLDTERSTMARTSWIRRHSVRLIRMNTSQDPTKNTVATHNWVQRLAKHFRLIVFERSEMICFLHMGKYRRQKQPLNYHLCVQPGIHDTKTKLLYIDCWI